MNEISHTQAQWLLRRALDGALPEAQWMALQAHLETCPPCRAYRDGLDGMHKSLRRAMQRRWPVIAGPLTDLPAALRDLRRRRSARARDLRRAAGAVGGLLGLVALGALVYRLSAAPTVLPTAAPTAQAAAPPSPTPLPLPFSALMAYTRRNPPPRSDHDICLLTVSPFRVENACDSGPADDLDPVWSPDGSLLAFLSDSAGPQEGERRYHIYTMTPAGTRRTRLAPAANIRWQPPLSWSGNGRWLAVPGVDASGVSWVYLVAANDDRQPRRLGRTRFASAARFAPGSSRLAYNMADSSFNGLAVLDVESGAFVPIAALESEPALAQYSNGAFDWSADGSRLAFLSYRVLPGSVASELRATLPLDERFTASPASAEPSGGLSSVLASEGREQPAAGPLLRPTWLPDGSGVLFLQSLRGPQSALAGPGDVAAPATATAPALGIPASGPGQPVCFQPRLVLLDERGPLPASPSALPPFCAQVGFDQGSWAGRWLVLVGRETSSAPPGIYALRVPTTPAGGRGLVRLLDLLDNAPPDRYGPMRIRPGR